MMEQKCIDKLQYPGTIFTFSNTQLTISLGLGQKYTGFSLVTFLDRSRKAASSFAKTITAKGSGSYARVVQHCACIGA
eukprot:CAMPEP_0206404046 /NCGR_PEP_ID=MMETSP0294-20121207/28109_1 /ASSEMBLY_ACC=CAM_ASM_000327 /TAXON_ID=39354 /ORGANISM="Heterosigma akashiwo, Strain CCMP2393" /LENGTH=77 /DNA_ID=CAMNT_0053861817 /DNA_START=96 /DNA_END=329 /DNA_ORIENTATION=+